MEALIATSATVLRCYVLTDPTRGEPTHQHLGAIQMYVYSFDRYVKTDSELPTVGIVLCGGKNDAVVELTLPQDANIYASQYQLYLPSKQELKAQLENIQRELDNREEGAFFCQNQEKHTQITVRCAKRQHTGHHGGCSGRHRRVSGERLTPCSSGVARHKFAGSGRVVYQAAVGLGAAKQRHSARRSRNA